MINIKEFFAELSLMQIKIPTDPAEFHDKILLLQTFLNRCIEIEVEIRADLFDKKEEKVYINDIKNLLEQVKSTYSNLKLTKQNFNMIINKPEIFNMYSTSKERDLDDSDIPGQENIGTPKPVQECTFTEEDFEFND